VGDIAIEPESLREALLVARLDTTIEELEHKMMVKVSTMPSLVVEKVEATCECG